MINLLLNFRLRAFTETILDRHERFTYEVNPKNEFYMCELFIEHEMKGLYDDK